MLLVVVLIEVFDIYGKLLNLMGFKNSKDCEVSDDKNLEILEGKKIIMKAKLSDEKKRLKLSRMNMDNFRFYHSPNQENASQLTLMEGSIFNFAPKTDFDI